MSITSFLKNKRFFQRGTPSGILPGVLKNINNPLRYYIPQIFPLFTLSNIQSYNTLCCDIIQVNWKNLDLKYLNALLYIFIFLLSSKRKLKKFANIFSLQFYLKIPPTGSTYANFCVGRGKTNSFFTLVKIFFRGRGR